MTTTVIIDAIVVIVLVAFAMIGVKQGLLRSLAGLVILALSLVGAGMLASTFSAPLAKIIAPALEDYVSRQVDEAVFAQFGEADLEFQLPEMGQLEGLLEQLGVDTEEWEAMGERILESVSDRGAAVKDAVLETVLESLVQSLLYGILFVLAFVLLVILLHVLLSAMGFVMKLPGLRMLNALGGGIVGLIEGVLLVFLGVWVARQLGVSFETETLAEAHILHIFTTNTPLSVLSFLNH